MGHCGIAIVGTMPKTVIHIFHDDPDSLLIGTRLPWRINQVAAEHDLTVEVFCFGPAQRHLAETETETGVTFNRQIDALIADGVRVGACVNVARADGTEQALRDRGLTLSVARDEFVRFTLERATVIKLLRHYAAHQHGGASRRGESPSARVGRKSIWRTNDE